MSHPRYQLSKESQAPGGADLQMRVSNQLDALFSEYMELYQRIRDSRNAANLAIKEGFFKLAEARHSMPSASYDSAAYSGRDMLPQWYARCTAADTEDEKRSEDGERVVTIDGQVNFDLAVVELKDAPEDEEEEDEFAIEKGDGGLRKRAAGKDEEKSDAASSSAATSSESDAPVQPAELDLRASPLQWFGALIPPSLAFSADSFRSSLAPLLEVATLSQQLSQAERKFKYLGQLQQASHVDPAVEDELREILEKISISSAKKSAAKTAEPVTVSASASASS